MGEVPPPPPAPPSIPRPSKALAKSPSPRKAAAPPTPARVAAEARGNVVAPVAGEMLVGLSEDDRTTLHKIPPNMRRDEFDEDAHTLTHRPLDGAPAILEAYAEEAKAALEDYKEALKVEEETERRGRLHYEIARIAETILGDSRLAVEHYRQALDATPDRLPVITSARRVMLARDEHAEALELFDRELRLTADRGTKASLMFAKARVLETKLGRAKEARDRREISSPVIPC